MKQLATLLTVLLPFLCAAQDEEAYKPASAESEAYHQFRLKETVPPYGLAKVKKLIAGAQEDGEKQWIKQKDYKSLTLREKFTYHMIFGEAYSQNCDVMPTIQDEDKKIMGELPDILGETSWSDEQVQFFNDNRDSVIALIKESAGRSGRIGANYKQAIVEMGAMEIVPFLIEFYKRDHKDRDILTVLLLLMKRAKYEPFVKSVTYEKLYGPNSTYLSYIQYNQANEDLIIQRIMNMFNAMS